jgi:SAM-dependent methyltransferase
MRDPDEAWLASAPAGFRKALQACGRVEVPANIAAMQLLMAAHEAGEAEQVLETVLAEFREGLYAREARRIDAVLDLLRANPDAFLTIKRVLHAVRHDDDSQDEDESVRRWAAAFDAAAESHPDGSVALYALGSPELLKAATAEVVDRLREWGVLGPGRAVLDLGCGIGRFAEALAADVGSIVGTDISERMVAASRRRCAALGNVSFRQSSGHDLAVFAAMSFDLVLAVDTFPYIVRSGLAERHLAEASRTLRPGGDLVVLNYSYRGDPQRDRADLRGFADRLGFEVLRDGTRPFMLWDGLAFHLAKRPGYEGRRTALSHDPA